MIYHGLADNLSGGNPDMVGRSEENSNRLERGAKSCSGAVQPISRRQEGCLGAAEGIAVVWEGSQFITHSLAIVNRELCSELIKRGVDLGIRLYEDHEFGAGSDPQLKGLEERFGYIPRTPTKVHVRHQWPPSFVAPPSGKWVMIQPWEYGFILKSWLEPMQTRVDEIWVPSRYARQCYIDSGISGDKVFVIPNGVDVQRFHPQAQPAMLETRKSFKFLFVGGTIPRKGIRLLLETYRQTFTKTDDVCLVIKDMGSKGVYQGSTSRVEIEAMMADPDAPEIEYIDHHLCHEQVAGLYTAADVLVHPYHGEGFGMPIAEAMACGIPAIVTGLGAATDFCNQENAYLIESSRHDMPTTKVSGEEACGHPWIANPDPSSFSRLMREAVEHPRRRQIKGEAARETIVREFTWKHAVDMIEVRLKALSQSTSHAPDCQVEDPRSLSLVALKRALRQTPNSPTLICEIATRLAELGLKDEGAEILASAVTRLPDDPLLSGFIATYVDDLGP